MLNKFITDNNLKIDNDFLNRTVLKYENKGEIEAELVNIMSKIKKGRYTCDNSLLAEALQILETEKSDTVYFTGIVHQSDCTGIKTARIFLPYRELRIMELGILDKVNITLLNKIVELDKTVRSMENKVLNYKLSLDMFVRRFSDEICLKYALPKGTVNIKSLELLERFILKAVDAKDTGEVAKIYIESTKAL